MTYERPFLELPLPNPSEREAYEQWLERQEDKEMQEESTELERVVIIEL